MPKNIKIENMTVDGMEDINWEDIINTGESEEEGQESKTSQEENA